jgi:hypothetical protein
MSAYNTADRYSADAHLDVHKVRLQLLNWRRVDRGVTVVTAVSRRARFVRLWAGSDRASAQPSFTGCTTNQRASSGAMSGDGGFAPYA